jgi:hypothetical protein
VVTPVATSEAPRDVEVSVPDAQRRDLSTRLAFWAFVTFLVVGFFVVLFRLGSYHWFFRDDFQFLSERRATSLDDLFRPHNTHWSTVPILVFRALWSVFGMRTYLPYQACVLLLHLSACALLRVIMRRAGVGPWIATAAASAFVLFGPGQQNIIWAFQIGFTGSLVFGLGQIVLADHDGPLDWRDALAVAAGVLALLSSGVGVTMAITAGLAIFLRRGWRVALVQTGPLAAAYLVWWLVERPTFSSEFGRPSVATLFRWVRSAETGTFLALGHFRVVAVVLALVFVAGGVLVWSCLGARAFRRRIGIPAAMLLGGVAFSALTAIGRWISGPDFARSSRYVHIVAALTLPALAVAADALARRWQLLVPAAIALFLVAIPWNAGKFDQETFGVTYMDRREHALTNVVRLPEATEVPRDVRPIPDIYLGSNVTIGFLLDAEASGKLRASSEPMTHALEDELRVRLGVSQHRQPLPENRQRELNALARGAKPEGGGPQRCRTVNRPLELHPKRGTDIWIADPVTIAIADGSPRPPGAVTFTPTDGNLLTIELADLDLRLAPPRGARSFRLC